MTKSINEEEIAIPFEIKKWKDYPVGTFNNGTKEVEEAVSKTMERIMRIVPSIKKSSKILVYSSGSSFTPIYLSAISGCKIECITNDEKSAKKIEKEVVEIGLEEKITVSHKLFYETLFHSNTFDMVWSIAENYQDDRALEIFREVARVLVPEGRYVMCHPFRSMNNDEVQYEELAVVENFLKKANSVDLERVYVKEYKTETIAHYKALEEVKRLAAKDVEEVKEYLKFAKDDKYVWALLVFQKRNN
jgi:sarcosine/dimethylglycine N-methyltransferase